MSARRLAAPELTAVQVGGMTRHAFLLRTTLAAGAAVGASLAAPHVQRAVALQTGNDIDILNFALTLEHLEARFYEEALDEVRGLGDDLRELVERLAADEADHVQGLTETINTLGGTPVEAPDLDFGRAFAGRASFLKLANTLEDTGVSAYNGAAPMITSHDILGAAGSIVQIEARHAALIRLERDRPPAPRDFDSASTEEQVRSKIDPFLT